jgi:hypothetical protein
VKNEEYYQYTKVQSLLKREFFKHNGAQSISQSSSMEIQNMISEEIFKQDSNR